MCLVADMTALIGQVELIAEQKDRQQPNFWNGIIKPECELVRSLADNTLDIRQDAIVRIVPETISLLDRT